MATVKQLMTLLGKAGVNDETRREMIFNFTNGRSESVKDLNERELQLLCNELQSRFLASDYEIQMRKKRSIVLTIATRTGIKSATSWNEFNKWMLNSSIYKKELHAYDYEELDQLIKQFRGLEGNYKKSAQKTGTKAWIHANGFSQISQN